VTSSLQGQRLISFPQQFRKNTAWSLALGMTLLGVFLSAPAQAAVFTVNSSADAVDVNPGNGVCETAPGNGVCTLRAAIQEANALAGADEVILPSLPSPNSYLLTIATELGINGNLTITGGGASTTIIDGNKSVRPNGRVLVIGSGITVNINGVTIRNGGTGITGGGIFNGGTLTLTNSTVSGNAAGNDGGGIFNDAGTLTLINSIVSGNNAGVDGGGILNNPGGTLTLTNSTVTGNAAGDDGGGIRNVAGGTLTLTNSTVSGNTAGDDGGGIRNFGTTNVFSSTIANNRANLNPSPTNIGGGGVDNGGTLTLTNSTVSGNTAGNHAGGILNNPGGTLTLTNSTVSGNAAGNDGAGIFNDAATLTLINSTVSGNTAGHDGGGIRNFGTANVFSSTIANNRAGLDASRTPPGIGGGVYNGSEQGATFNFQNTILANNQLGTNPNNIHDCAGTLTSQGYNLIRIAPPGECNVAPVTGDIFFSDPLLGPLQNNGGPTQTHALASNSPAINAGNPGGCGDNFGALLTTDQRGFPRPTTGCDIGAYELFTGSNTSVVAALLPSSRSVQVGTPATAFATIINTGQGIAADCSIAPLTSVPASFVYQTTNPANNQVTGFPNTPVNIAAGAAQSFVFAITPSAPIAPTDVQFSFTCANTELAPINIGLNTLLLSASDIPVPDIVALAATTTNDGIVNIPGANGTGAFAVATVNVGATGTITASADTGGLTLPVNISLCQTDPATGQCISVIGPSVTTTINANATPTFGIFLQGNGNVPFDPAANRIFVRFKDGGGVTRGSTSVAIRTQ
jgi:CSLREA domain-containing protein